MAVDVEATIIVPEVIIRQYEKRPLTKWCRKRSGRYSNCSAGEFCLHKVLADHFVYDSLHENTNRLLARIGGYVIEEDRLHFWVTNELLPQFVLSLSKSHPVEEIRAAYFNEYGSGGRMFIFKGGVEGHSHDLEPIVGYRYFLTDFRLDDVMGFFERGVFPTEKVVAATVGTKYAALIYSEHAEEWDGERILQSVKNTCPNGECHINYLNAVLMITDDFADRVACKLKFEHEILWSYDNGKLLSHP